MDGGEVLQQVYRDNIRHGEISDEASKLTGRPDVVWCEEGGQD